jgi:GNAT superfamily N-acetyltransferase
MMIEYRKIDANDMPAIIALCKAESWPSFVSDPERAWRALTAPGVITLVAVDSGSIIGFVQMQTDGEIQAHLSLILITPDRRGHGIGTRLIQEALRISGAERIDLTTERAPGFYRSFAHYEWPGFRLHPQFNKDGTPNQAFQPTRTSRAAES